MNKHDEFDVRQKYVEGILGQALKPKKGFGGIKYARNTMTDQAYIRISDLRGSAITLDITALTLEEVLTDVSKIVLVGVLGKHDKMTLPASIVTDGNDLLKLSPLFVQTGMA